MKRKLLVAAICTALVVPVVPMLAHAQDATQGTKEHKKEAKKLKEVLVTGSLIPRSEIETATPVITITAEDIKKKGFTSVYQALRAQPIATGQVQGEQNSNSFTPGAQPAPSLLGLPPNFTLTLVDGHPLADYPLLYNAAFGITDISSIPLGMVDRIEVVPGNQSSIYGSSAIAGVINIILKHHVSGMHFDYQTGGYSSGGGASQRLQMVGGYDAGRLGLVYGLQYTTRQPIFGFQRKLTASTLSNPNPQQRVPSLSYFIYDFNNGAGVDPNSIVPNACGNIAYQYGGTTVRGPILNPANDGNPFDYVNAGYACGSNNINGYTTLQNNDHSASGYLSAHFRLNENAELYGNMIYTLDSSDSYSGPGFNYFAVNFPNFVFFNGNTQTKQEAVQSFSPEETGSLLAGSTHYVGRAYSFYGGLKGTVGQSDFNYDLFYARSQYNLSSNQLQAVTSRINSFFQNQFLGPQLGTTSGYPIYNPNYANFFKGITPAQYNSFIGVDHLHSETYTQNINLNVTNTDLIHLPAGDVGAAGVLQTGDQRWYLPENPFVQTNPTYFYNGSITNGQGRRNNYAAALEFHVPIFSMLSADLSARYDHFHNDGGGSSSRPTYKAAFSFRPLKTLLLRANYATAFRMPDMGYSFIGPGSNFYQGITDYYNCEILQPGIAFSQCPSSNNPNINYTARGESVANPFLKPITAKSWGAGFVWSPTDHASIEADYYSVRISNEVQYQSINSLLLTDAQCLLGQIPTTSPTCQAAFQAIQRGGTKNLVQTFNVRPINIAREAVSGITASGNYDYDAGRYGDFNFGAQYNVALKHTLQLAPGAVTYDLLHNPYYDYLSGQGGSAIGPEFKSIFSADVTWNIGNWSSTLTGIRYGKLPNFAAYSNPTVYNAVGAGRVKPWVLYNFTVRYNLTPDAKITFTVDNLFDSMPPQDNSFNSWPYYDYGAYNPFGRSYFLDFNYRFGG